MTRETFSVSYIPPEKRVVTFIQFLRTDGTVRMERPMLEMDRLGFPDAWAAFISEDLMFNTYNKPFP